MERLTKLDKYGHPYTNENINCRNLVSEDGVNYQYVGYVDNFKAFDGKPIDKLCAIENIEEELGIPLEVLFKALKEGFYVRFVGLPARRLPEYSRFDFYNKKIDECNIKDYGKTWALTREELE